MKKKNSAKKRLVAAVAMLAISSASLFGSTYAWFTMNKQVSVTGMEVKAHAEEGLLINEVAAAADTNWDELATGGATDAVVLRPASTKDLVTWWHANSKLSADEAGIDNLSGTVLIDDSGNKYLDISPYNVNDYALFDAGAGSSHAETHIYFKDASFGNTSGTCEAGEGFYVKYTYYIKSSGDSDLTVSDLQVRVKATKNTTGDNASGASDNLDPCLRVGVTMPVSSESTAATAGTLIFAPITSADDSYNVTTAANGSTYESVTFYSGTTGNFTDYQTLNNANTNITIPKVTSDGIPVYVYVWFEGEDTHCMSNNLTDALAAYDIDVQFLDADIY